MKFSSETLINETNAEEIILKMFQFFVINAILLLSHDGAKYSMFSYIYY